MQSEDVITLPGGMFRELLAKDRIELIGPDRTLDTELSTGRERKTLRVTARMIELEDGTVVRCEV